MRRSSVRRAGVLLTVTAALSLGSAFWPGAAQAQPTPTPRPSITVDLDDLHVSVAVPSNVPAHLDDLHVSVDLPLNVPALLGAGQRSVAAMPIARTPIRSAVPAAPPAVPTTALRPAHPASPRTTPSAQPRDRSVDAAPRIVEQPALRARAPVPKRAEAHQPGFADRASIFQQALRPPIPVFVLVAIMCVCAVGTTLLVASAGRRGRHRA